MCPLLTRRNSDFLTKADRIRINQCRVLRIYDFLDGITEPRTGCGVRKNMIREANRPFDEVDLNWPMCSLLESLIQEYIGYRISKETQDKRNPVPDIDVRGGVKMDVRFEISTSSAIIPNCTTGLHNAMFSAE